MRKKTGLRKLPFSLPPYWRLASPPILSWTQKRDWQLVLDASSIPYILIKMGGVYYLYVPPLLERLAREELRAFEKENKKPAKPDFHLRRHKNPWLASLFLLPLLIWHAMQQGYLPYPAAWPPPDLWVQLGELDYFPIRYHDQWQRLITALTLHAGATHIFGNLVFCAIFLSLLASYAGAGRAFLISLLGGVCGNLFSVFLHKPGYMSIGFSTALFAAIGASAGMALWEFKGRQKFLKPVAAACALLALLGTEGANTDYGAHISGLCCGFVLGIFSGLCVKNHYWQLSQTASAILAYALIALSWHAAFNSQT